MGNGASSPTKARPPQQAGAGAGASLFAAATVAKKLKQKAQLAKKAQSARAEAALARLAELQEEYEDVFGEAPSGMYRNKIGWLEQQLKLRQAAELWDRHGSPKGSSRASSPGPQNVDGELLIAAEAGDVEAIELLIEQRGANPNAKTEDHGELGEVPDGQPALFLGGGEGQSQGHLGAAAAWSRCG